MKGLTLLNLKPIENDLTLSYMSQDGSFFKKNCLQNKINRPVKQGS